MIESLCRIALVTFVFLVWIAMGIGPALANDDKPKPPAGTPQVTSSGGGQSSGGGSNNRKTENLVGAMFASGIATTALRNQEYGAAWAFGLTVAGAGLIEGMHSNSSMSNVYYAIGGAAVGTIGTCKLLMHKSYIGCAFSF